MKINPTVLKGIPLVALGIGLSSLLPRLASAAEVVQLTPTYRAQRVLAAADPASARPYLAFPSLIDLGSQVMVSYKHGSRHGGDTDGAALDLIRINKATGEVTVPQPLAAAEGRIMQMGEWVRYPNGDVAVYIDYHQSVSPSRVGIRGMRSTDGGTTFAPLEQLGVLDGVEYGYPLGFQVEGTTTWMMAMSFANLQGGRSIYPPRPYSGQVSMLRSEDSGRTWSFVRDLSHEFGDIPINESSFLRYADGFVVVTRGYDSRVRLHFTDADFKVRNQIDLTATYPFITRYIGRPRLFTRDGRVYLVGRNWTEISEAPAGAPKDGGPNMPMAMKLCLFRLDPTAPAVTAYAILDNAEKANVTDGYYPMPYFVAKDGKVYFRIVDYKGVDRHPPQIIEFEYLWNEIR